MKKTFLIILIVILTSMIGFLAYKKLTVNEPHNGGNQQHQEPQPLPDIKDFDYAMIHLVNSEEDNYLISPLSIAYALSILKEGALEETKVQIENALGNYNLGKNTTFEERIGIANALFIKEDNKSDIKKEFINNIKNNFDADVLFDEFTTPDVINNWAKEKTYGMIDKVLDNISKDFVLGIINALAIDVDWKVPFEGGLTRKDAFTNYNGTTSTVDMMHTENSFNYIENDKAKGIVKDYEIYGDNKLEFIAILPNGDLKEYINNFDKDELDSLIKNTKIYDDNLDLYLGLPKFNYDYTYENFKDDLVKLGIKDAFNGEVANFKNILNEEADYNIYVSEAIHKTHIDLNENGTKAAAITYFGMEKATAIMPEKEKISITFNRPFLYIIKDKNSDNIWFFGAIYNLPNNK